MLRIDFMNYTTIKNFAKDSFIEKKSEFIGYIAPVKTNEEAVEFINRIKSENRKAKHNVYAYILRDNNITRYSDDGEPQGTAGMPVLDVLLKENLTDVCVVVTRYFGGILLGGGGLVRAYSHACKLAVDSAVKMEMYECFEVTLKFNYSLYGKIEYSLNEFDIKMLSDEFSDSVTLTLLVKADIYQKLVQKLNDITNGKISISKSELKFGDFANL